LHDQDADVVKPLLRYRLYALISLLLWLFVSWSGVHGHFCFDGQEPPISLHFDLLGEHAMHVDGEASQDVDIEQPLSILVKTLKLDLFVPVFLAVVTILRERGTTITIQPIPSLRPRHIVGALPLLRAPPAIPA
jgi:hypothetical protein